MTREHRILSRLSRDERVPFQALLSDFGESCVETLDILAKAHFVDAFHKDGDPYGITEFVGITDRGRERLHDLEAERKEKQSKDWWARGLAIAALLISVWGLINDGARS